MHHFLTYTTINCVDSHISKCSHNHASVVTHNGINVIVRICLPFYRINTFCRMNSQTLLPISSTTPLLISMSSYDTIRLLFPFYFLNYTWTKPPEQISLTFLIRKGTRQVQLTFPIWKCFVLEHHSRGHRPLAQDQGLQPSRNIFPWVRMTHWKSPEVLGMLRKAHRTLPMTQGTSLVFHSILYYYV